MISKIERHAYNPTPTMNKGNIINIEDDFQVNICELVLSKLDNSKIASQEYLIKGLAKIKTMTRTRNLTQEQWDITFKHFLDNLTGISAGNYYDVVKMVLDRYNFFPSWAEMLDIVEDVEKIHAQAKCCLKASIDAYTKKNLPEVKKKHDPEKARLGRELLENMIKKKIRRIQGEPKL